MIDSQQRGALSSFLQSFRAEQVVRCKLLENIPSQVMMGMTPLSFVGERSARAGDVLDVSNICQ